VIPTALAMIYGVAVRAPGAKGGLETVTVLCALLAVLALLARCRRERTTSDVLLVVAALLVLVLASTIHAAPALSGIHDPIAAVGVRLAGSSLIAVAFLAAALARGSVLNGALRRRLVQVGLLALLTIGAGAALDAIAAGGAVAETLQAERIEEIGRSPVVVAVGLGSCAVLSAAGVLFALRAGRRDRDAALLAGVAFLLVGAGLGFIIDPETRSDAIMPGDGLRLGACALLLAFGVRGYFRARAEDQGAAVMAERERIAADLHDGLAQDLAVIAVHAQRLESELGSQHPLALASRGALATSRGVITDLASAGELTMEAALRHVGAELAQRFGVRVVVRAGDGADSGDGGEHDVSAAEREELVRIAREAIVNAARHGQAQLITVSLEPRDGSLRLTVRDDGCGIADSEKWQAGGGFGVRMMRERAGRLGAALDIRSAASGGTEVEVVVP
jgi:signal transduction histidine kinase